MPRGALVLRRSLVLLGALAAGCGDRPAPAGHEPPRAAEDGAPVPAAAPPAQAPVAAPTLDPSALPGSIYFHSERDGDLEIYRWRAGAPLERITHDPRADFVAEVAPDGSGLTRVVAEEGAVPEAHLEQILWMPTAGQPVPVGPPGRRARAPSWAPDRSFVVYESDAEGAFSDVWRWQPDGTTRRLTTTAQGAFEPAISPDGQRVAYVSSQDGNPELYVMAADGSAQRRLTTWRRDDIAPAWSPDGTRLAFLRREQGGERLFVLTVPPAGRDDAPALQRMVATAEGEKVKHAEHAWSPDGRQLAYTVHRPDAAPHVAVTDVADGRTRPVTPTSLRATMPAWSPDGQALAFTATLGDPAALDVYVTRLADGAWARLVDDPAPDWLPRWATR